MATSFNGSSSSIGMPSSFMGFDRDQPFTLACWVYNTRSKGGSIWGAPVFSRLQAAGPNSGIELGFLWTSFVVIPYNRLVPYLYILSVFGSNAISVIGDTDYQNDQWEHVAVSYDGSSSAWGVSVYRNGTGVSRIISQNSLSASVVNSVTPAIGRRPADAAQLWTGDLQGFGAWDAVLSAAEVAALANGRAPDRVRPQRLLSHVPMYRDIIDTRGNALTPTSVSVSSRAARVYL